MSRRARLWIALGLGAVAIATFWPVQDQPFLEYDDDVYVVDNPAVNRGLSLDGVRAAFLDFHAANWHPITWLSHQLDVTLFGLEPSRHHATSLLLHALNSLLLFLWLDRAAGEGARRRSALVAAVFAVHPMAIDSVAWIAERKNLLATGFGFGALLCWVGYVRAPGSARYAAVFGLLALGLMSKPMLVVLPVLMLLLDYWPLRRGLDEDVRWLVLEKLPLFGLSIGTAVLTVLAQSSGGAVASLEPFPVSVRLANAIVALPTYLGLLLWPAWPNGLAVLHPHPGSEIAAWRWLGSLGLIGLVTLGVVRAGRQRPYLWMGAAWGAIGLLPVLGLVQVGAQSHAERYAYLPMVGVLIAITWWTADLARERGLPRVAIGPIAVVGLLLLAIATRAELRHWRSEIALFSRAIEVHDRTGGHTPHAMLLHYQLGTALQATGRREEAVASYRRALEYNANDPRPHNNLGTSLIALGRTDEARIHFEHALAANPSHPSSLYNLAHLEAQYGDATRARALYARFLETGAYAAETRNDAIRALLELAAPEVAAAAALQAAPRDAETLSLAAEGLRQLGRDAQAREALVLALRLAPDDRALRNNLAHLFATSQDPRVRDPARALELMHQLEAEGPLDAAERDTLSQARASAARASSLP